MKSRPIDEISLLLFCSLERKSVKIKMKAKSQLIHYCFHGYSFFAAIVFVLIVNTTTCIAADTIPVPILQIGGGINWASFSPDGTKIIADINKTCISIWDIVTGFRRNILDTNQAFQDTIIQSVALKNKSRLISYSRDGLLEITAKPYNDTIYLWNVSSGALIRKFSTKVLYGRTLNRIDFSPDGSKIFSCASDTSAKIWETSTGNLLQSLVGHNDVVWSICCSPDGTTAITASTDKTVKVWDVLSGSIIRTITGHTDGVPSAVFSHDGKLILSCSWDKTAKIWNAATGELLRTFEGHNRGLISADFSPDDSLVLTTSNYLENNIKLWKAASGSQIMTCSLTTHSAQASIGLYSNNGLHVITGSDDRTLILWNAATGDPIRRFIGHGGKITSVIFSPDDSKILSGSYDSTAILWEANTGIQLRSFTRHKSIINAIAFSHDGSMVLTGFYDSTAVLWDATTGDSLQTFVCPKGPVRSVAFSSSGAQILTACGGIGNPVQLWDVKTGVVIRNIVSTNLYFSKAIFSPDNAMVIAIASDSSAILWDASTGERIRIFKDTDKIRSIAFSPDGMTMLTGSNTSKIWDIATANLVRVFSDFKYYENNASYITCVSFSPDGKAILSLLISTNLKALIWNNSIMSPIKSICGPNYHLKEPLITFDRYNKLIVKNLSIPFGKATFELFALNGKCILHYEVRSENKFDNCFTIPAHLSIGPYIFRVKSDNKVLLEGRMVKMFLGL